MNNSSPFAKEVCAQRAGTKIPEKKNHKIAKKPVFTLFTLILSPCIIINNNIGNLRHKYKIHILRKK